MTSSTRDRIVRPLREDRVVVVGVGLTIVLVAAGTAAQLINYGFDLHSSVLDSSRDGGAFGVVGDVALASAALAAWGVLGRVRPTEPALAALPVLLSFLALDKALRLHDEIADWPLYYVPVLLATLVVLVLVGRRLSGASLRLITVGLALLATSLVIHFAGPTVLRELGASENGWPSQIKMVVKHGTEVTGWLIVTLALVLGARERAANVRGASRFEVAPSSRASI